MKEVKQNAVKEGFLDETKSLKLLINCFLYIHGVTEPIFSYSKVLNKSMAFFY